MLEMCRLYCCTSRPRFFGLACAREVVLGLVGVGGVGAGKGREDYQVLDRTAAACMGAATEDWVAAMWWWWAQHPEGRWSQPSPVLNEQRTGHVEGAGGDW